MTKDILQIITAIFLLVTLLFLLFRFVKPRRNQADFIIGMLKKIRKGDK